MLHELRQAISQSGHNTRHGSVIDFVGCVFRGVVVPIPEIRRVRDHDGWVTAAPESGVV